MPEGLEPDAKPPGIEPDSVKFDYVKSNYFRVVSAAGIVGGITPATKKIQASFYSERWPIPRQVTHDFDPKAGKLGAERTKERVARDAIIREVEVMVELDIDAAVQIRKWLDEKIEKYREVFVKGDSASGEVKKDA